MGVAGKQSAFYEQKLKMKWFALPRALRIMLQLDWCNSTHYERIAPFTEPTGGKHGTGTAGVLWACRAGTGTATRGDYQLMWERNAKENKNSAVPAYPIKQGREGRGGGWLVFINAPTFISVSQLIRCGKCFLLCQRKREWKWQLIMS